MMRLARWVAGLAVALVFGAGAAAADRLVVVELFTSQGCSSCPPADALLTELTARDDVLPLALHVDYWDYIGWPDSFASPAFTARQKAYAHAAGNRTIYTPQMIVDGRDHLVGTQAMQLGALIENRGAQAQTVALDVVRAGGRVEIRAVAEQPLARPVVVQLVRYLPERHVEIERGENAGKTLTYSNIVTDWRVIGRWAGDAPLSLSADATGEGETAVILQEEGPGEIVAAAVAP